jgi:hypothetical protein
MEERTSIAPPTPAMTATAAPAASAASAASASVPPLLSLPTVMAMRRVLRAYGEGWALDNRLRRAARAVAQDAHRRGALAEQMLVAVKQEWGALSEVRALPPGDSLQDLSSRFITLCIREFFSPGASSATDVPAVRRAD